MSGYDFDDELPTFGANDIAPRKELPQKVEFDRKTAAANFVPALDRAFSEPCTACRGSGNWVGGWGLRQVVRKCFKCKGTGRLTFKTDAATRAKARDYSANRKAEKIQEFSKEHPEIVEWLQKSGVASNKPFAFAVSLQDALLKYGSLTDGQVRAAQSCIAKYHAAIERNQARKENAPSVNAEKLETAFAKAAKSANRPGAMGVWMKPLYLQSGKLSIVFQSGYGKWAGFIFVKSLDGRRLGMIKDAKFVAQSTCSETELAAVLDCCNDPSKAALAYGKAWSRCAICNHTLTNDGSIERGIGPYCAEKFGF